MFTLYADGTATDKTIQLDGTVDPVRDIETINLDNKVKNGRYNLMGQPIDENYKGIVIENGVKKIQR